MIKAGIALIFIGAVLLFAGMILSAQKADFAGLIMIGPVPVAFGTSPEITLAAMFLGLVLMLMFFILGMMRSEKRTDFEENSKRESEEMKVKAGGVVLIGPVPIIFGSDKRSALLAMVLAIVILLLAIILLK